MLDTHGGVLLFLAAWHLPLGAYQYSSDCVQHVVVHYISFLQDLESLSCGTVSNAISKLIRQMANGIL